MHLIIYAMPFLQNNYELQLDEQRLTFSKEIFDKFLVSNSDHFVIVVTKDTRERCKENLQDACKELFVDCYE